MAQRGRPPKLSTRLTRKAVAIWETIDPPRKWESDPLVLLGQLDSFLIRVEDYAREPTPDNLRAIEQHQGDTLRYFLAKAFAPHPIGKWLKGGPIDGHAIREFHRESSSVRYTAMIRQDLIAFANRVAGVGRAYSRGWAFEQIAAACSMDPRNLRRLRRQSPDWRQAVQPEPGNGWKVHISTLNRLRRGALHELIYSPKRT